eukprot:COSAG06_NODE_30286_length_541_cov_1.138009_1_plen_117_part_10
MSRAAALRQLLIPLARHCIQPRFRHVHRHALGELLVWDNRSTAHRSSPLTTGRCTTSAPGFLWSGCREWLGACRVATCEEEVRLTASPRRTTAVHRSTDRVGEFFEAVQESKNIIHR